MIANAVEDDVVPFASFGEILVGVINDAICADGSHHIHIPGTAYAGYICAERFSDLHRERTHAACRSVNQEFLPGLNVPFVAESLQCGQRRHRHRSL